MRNSGQRFWAILTVTLGVVTGILVYRQLSRVDPAVSQAMVQVVVAREKIPQGTRISPEMIKTVQVPARYAHPLSVSDPRDAINSYAIADLWPDQAVLKSQLSVDRNLNDFPYRIPEGTRAMTVAVDPVTGVAGLIKPGHYVDVLVSYQTPNRPGEVTVTTILQKILVLAVGTDLQKKDGAQLAETVTLAVTPEESQVLMLGESIGRLKLVLRPAGEDATLRLPSVDTGALQSRYP